MGRGKVREDSLILTFHMSPLARRDIHSSYKDISIGMPYQFLLRSVRFRDDARIWNSRFHGYSLNSDKVGQKIIF